MLILTDSVKWIVGRCDALYGYRLWLMDCRHYNVEIGFMMEPGARSQTDYIMACKCVNKI